MKKITKVDNDDGAHMRITTVASRAARPDKSFHLLI